MYRLGLPSSTIASIIADPHVLRSPERVKLSASDASYILSKGYTGGIRAVFILNASLSALATVVSIVMIKHKDLPGGGDDLENLGGGEKSPSSDAAQREGGDIL